jgi:putative oxidoreductase
MTASPRLRLAAVWAVRGVLAGLFLLAAVGKILNPDAFASVIRKFGVLPREWTHLPAILLPWIEAVAAVALLAGPWRRGGIAWLAMLLAGFIGLFVWAMAQGIQVDCGCFGSLEIYVKLLAGDVGPGSILRNLILLAGCAWLWRVESVVTRRQVPADPGT